MLAPALFALLVIPGQTCGGTERWAEKILTDAAAGQVDLQPQDTTVGGLLALGSPEQPIQGNERRGVLEAEFMTFRIEVVVAVAKIEADQDVHLGAKDPESGAAMVTEIPDPDCAKGSLVYDGIVQARLALLEAIGARGKTPAAIKASIHKMVGKRVRITGVAFFDRLHGQSTGNPDEEYSGVELHPIFNLQVLE